ncbi:MAG: hypothetical protein HY073_02885 [Deltaproteobacteria bacterium]|nr:hypothetical protein [Deltaproteobacteria bacterium]
MGIKNKTLKEEKPVPEKVITMEEWRKGAEKRKKVRDSILSLFDMKSLSRKGQKKYKKERMRQLKK